MLNVPAAHQPTVAHSDGEVSRSNYNTSFFWGCRAADAFHIRRLTAPTSSCWVLLPRVRAGNLNEKSTSLCLYIGNETPVIRTQFNWRGALAAGVVSEAFDPEPKRRHHTACSLVFSDPNVHPLIRSRSALTHWSNSYSSWHIYERLSDS